MIRHIVMLHLRSGYDPVELLAVLTELATLDLPGFDGFEHGPNRDFEGKSQGFAYGFICSFTDKDALRNYAQDPAHIALGARLVALCEGGGDGIFVVDLDVGSQAL